jgi:hypothetical protein
VSDAFDITEVDDEGHARLKREARAFEKLVKVTAGCPCDACSMAKWCQIECRT